MESRSAIELKVKAAFLKAMACIDKGDTEQFNIFINQIKSHYENTLYEDDFDYNHSHHDYPPRQIDLTPELMGSLLDLINQDQSQKSNNKKTELLKLLFIKFINDHFENVSLMSGIPEQLVKYFHHEAYETMHDHFFKKISENSRSLSAYLTKKALTDVKQCIIDGDVEYFKLLLNMQDQYSEKRSIPHEVHVSGFDYDSEPVYQTHYYPEVCDISQPLLNIDEYGEALLREAVERRQPGLVEQILNIKQVSSLNSTQGYYQKQEDLSFTLTPKMMRSLLDLITKPSNLDISQAGIDLALGGLPLQDVRKNFQLSHKIEFQDKQIEILKLLFIKFIDDHFKNHKLMAKIPEQLAKYFPLESDAMEIVQTHFLKKIAHHKNKALLVKTMCSIENTPQIIAKNEIQLGKMSLFGKRENYFDPTKMHDLRSLFTKMNAELMERITFQLEFAKNKRWSWDQSERVAELQRVFNAADQLIKKKWTDPTDTFKQLISLLITARNHIATDLEHSWFASKSMNMQSMDKILNSVINAAPMRNFFALQEYPFGNGKYTHKQLVEKYDQRLIYEGSIQLNK